MVTDAGRESEEMMSCWDEDGYMAGEAGAAMQDGEKTDGWACVCIVTWSRSVRQGP